MDTSPNNDVRCAICGGTDRPTTITHHTRRDGTMYVFENVPAYACDDCGEVSIDGIVLHQIDELIASGKVAPAPVNDYRALEREQFFGTIDAVQKRNRKVSAKRIEDDIIEAVKETRRQK